MKPAIVSKSNCGTWILCLLAVILAAQVALGDDPAPVADAPEVEFTREFTYEAEPLIYIKATDNKGVSHELAVPAQGVTSEWGEDITQYRWMPDSGAGGFGVFDLNWGYHWNKLWWSDDWPTWIGQVHSGLVFNIHWWEGPYSTPTEVAPHLPGQVFDLQYDWIWQPRVTDSIVGDFAISPGLFTDFKTKPTQSARLRGHARGLFSLTNYSTLVFGVDYINREKIKILPVGGLLWKPNSGTEFQMVFPNPRIAQRISRRGAGETWIYLAGEYGGGAWTYKDALERHDYVEYSDIRVIAGLSWREGNSKVVALEVGYVFDREVHVRRAQTDFHPHDTIMIGVTFLR